MGFVQERYKPVTCPVNSTTYSPSAGMGGFLCVTAGTITVVTNTTIPRVVVPVFAVAAGAYYPMPFHTSLEGINVTTAGGASGVLGVI